MKTKEFYQNFFADVMKYVKISNFAADCGIDQSCVSKFCKGQLKFLSIDDAAKLYEAITVYCKKIV